MSKTSFATGKRKAESECVPEGHERSVTYTMRIGNRRTRKKDAELPHERFIAFATNVPGIDCEEYAPQRGIETGYRMTENVRARTHSKNPDVRLLCFVFSSAIYNACAMVNAAKRYEMSISTGTPGIQQVLKEVLLFCYIYNFMVEPEPPPLGE